VTDKGSKKAVFLTRFTAQVFAWNTEEYWVTSEGDNMNDASTKAIINNYLKQIELCVAQFVVNKQVELANHKSEVTTSQNLSAKIEVFEACISVAGALALEAIKKQYGRTE